MGLAAQLLMSRGAGPRQRRRPAWLRLASASVSLVFVSTGCGGPGGGEMYQRSGYLLSGDTTKGPAIGTYFYHRNHINSSSVITDANGNVTARMVYLPFGELSQANSSGGDVVTSKFTGQEYDEELGLYYYGARYYDPAIGRFISADSIVPSASDAQAFNRYTYARDNPIVYVDPTGHFLDFIGNFFSWVWGGISAIGSAIASAATWAYNAAIDYVKFCARVYYFIGLTLYGIATNPYALASFVLGAILACTLVGIPAGLVLWAKATAIAIIATSMAQAAGVRNPYVLALIGVVAGVLGGGWSWSEFFKSAGKAAIGMGARAVGGGPGGLAADVAIMAVGAVDPKVNEEDLSLSPKGLDFIKRHEGYSATVYNDAAGNPTIGYGHLIRPGEDFSNGITEAGATQLLAQDVQIAVNAVNNRLNVVVSQNEFDALVDFTYNLGEGNLGRSTLLSNINSGNDVTLNNFTDWNRAGGVVNRGLIIRRTHEYNLYTNGNYGH
jgi:RHS repeat-associated protein